MHMGGHMKWHLVAVIAAVAGAALFGVNLAGLMCAAMMIPMVWMMVAPAVGKLRRGAPGSR